RPPTEWGTHGDRKPYGSPPRYPPGEPPEILRGPGGSLFQGNAEPRGPLDAEAALGVGTDAQPLVAKQLAQRPTRHIRLAGEGRPQLPEVPLERGREGVAVVRLLSSKMLQNDLEIHEAGPGWPAPPSANPASPVRERR